jgi:hypothetical protein
LLGPDSQTSAFLDRTLVCGWVRAFREGSVPEREISRGGLYQRVYMLLSLELWLRHWRPSWA